MVLVYSLKLFQGKDLLCAPQNSVKKENKTKIEVGINVFDRSGANHILKLVFLQV